MEKIRLEKVKIEKVEFEVGILGDGTRIISELEMLHLMEALENGFITYDQAKNFRDTLKEVRNY